jgi:hypothetical protein
MRRREFFYVLGSAAAWAHSASGQQREIRRIGVLSGLALNDPKSKARIDAFSRKLQRLGRNEGQNIRFDFRSGGETAANRRKNAAELVALAPEVILAIGSVSVDDLLQVTRTIQSCLRQTNVESETEAALHAFDSASADSEERHEPASYIDILKALDPNRPIREADISQRRTNLTPFRAPVTRRGRRPKRPGCAFFLPPHR